MDETGNDSSWRQLYADAILEIDLAKLSARIDAAKRAIGARTSELEANGAIPELKALKRAMGALSALEEIYFGPCPERPESRISSPV